MSKLSQKLGILAAVLVVGVCGGSSAEARRGALQDPILTVPGVDVSQFQGQIDWVQVREAGFLFGFARCSSGLTEDSQFAANYEGMRKAKMIRGAYQYFRPSLDPVAQANLILDRMGKLMPDDLPPVLDVESTDGLTAAAIGDAVRAWVSTVVERTGSAPIIYTSARFWGFLGLTSNFDALLWVAQWNVALPHPLPAGWTDWSFWQDTDSGSVPGIAGAVDLNWWNGTLQDLRALTRKNH
jgi:lysozyme